MKKKTYSLLVDLWGISIGISFVIATFFQSKDKYCTLFQTDKTYFYFAITLLIVTICVFFLYAIATKREMIMLKDYLDEKEVPRLRTDIFIIIFGLAVLFGFLISFTDNIFYYSIVLILLKTMDIFGDWHVLKSIKPLINKELNNSGIDSKKLNIVLIINKFYFDNPTILRDVIILSLYWIGLCFALSFAILDEILYRNLSYSIIISSMIFNEIIIHFWRIKRDKKLYPLEENAS